MVRFGLSLSFGLATPRIAHPFFIKMGVAIFIIIINIIKIIEIIGATKSENPRQYWAEKLLA